MTMRRISAVLALLACLGATAVETAPPSAPVSDPDAAANSSAAKPDAAKPAPETPVAKPAPSESKGAKTADGDFKPSEEISEDMSVAYPVDI